MIKSGLLLSLLFTLMFRLLFNLSVNSRNHNDLNKAALSPKANMIINEVFYLQAKLGHRLWPSWTASKAPFMYKTPQYDFLMYHPNPPNEFVKKYDATFGDSLWVRTNSDTTHYQAAFPVNGTWTVVITEPEENYSIGLWILKAVHELFHVHQHQKRQTRVINPFVLQYSDKHELSFPFPYDNEHILSIYRLEAEEIFKLIKDDALNDSEIRIAKRVFHHLFRVQNFVFQDSLHLKYKKWMEWNEGVARYTERELALMASDSAIYSPTEAFRQRMRSQYSEIWKSRYDKMINPIRFVGEGVKGRVMFYYCGMGKAYVLDKLAPQWKDRYFFHGLDQLIVNGL